MRVGITGHRGLPPAVANQVRTLLRDHAATYDARHLVAVSCIADGPDTWWAKEVLSAGGRIEVVVPAAEYRDGLPEWHHPDYDDLMKRASDIHTTGLDKSTSEAHQAGSEILVGLCDRLIAVWDGLPARGYGGTADVVSYAEQVGVPVTVLWPDWAVR
ncbi:hypothetical protein [Streptomyces sp. NPDC102360]|uniref:hypothetical protein n=1 Tax=Streptomyces sp. NPDC102360 TaxID=3366160 RepID=UPI0037F43432